MNKVKIVRRGMKRRDCVKHTNPEHHSYCPECGEELQAEQTIIESVCSSCRHLVGEEDKFCWQCGVPLENTFITEHYNTEGEQTTQVDFRSRFGWR